MLKIAAILFMVTSLGNAAPNPNLDATPPSTSAQPAQPYVAQPGPPVDAQFQHGAVDPRGTDAQPLAVRVVAMPQVAPPSAPPPAPPPPDNSGLLWVVIVFGALQSLLMIALVYFVMQMANAARRLAGAAEQSRPDNAAPMP